MDEATNTTSLDHATMSARELVQTCRQEISSLIKGEELRPLLTAKVQHCVGDSATQRPYSTWIDRHCGKTKAPKDPKKALAKGVDTDDKKNIVKGEKFRAYPARDSDLSAFEDWMGKVNQFWVCAATNIQRAIEAKDWQRLKLLCQYKEYASLFDTKAGLDFPNEVKKQVLGQFGRTIKMAKKRKDGKGYPSPNRAASRLITMTLPIYLNGGGRFNGEEFVSTYLRIGKPHNPSNHSGPRRGKYRSLRKLRPVRIRPKGGQSSWLEFDVLFHTRLSGFPKNVNLVCEYLVGPDGRPERRRWYVAIGTQSKLPPMPQDRRHAGLDINWRVAGDGLDVAAIGTEDGQRQSFNITFRENRRARRQKLGKSRDASGLPQFMPTPEGRRDYQKEMDKVKDELKARLKLHQKMGWKGIRKIADSTDDNSTECRKAVEWYDRARKQFAHMCQVETASRNCEYRRIAKEILGWCQRNVITDVGSPNDDYKEIAEQERDPDLEDYKRRIANVRDRNRQSIAPGILRSIIEWELKKAGIRVHRINPWKTSQRCPLCRADTKSMEKYFECSGCGKRLHRDDVAAFNAATLAHECSDGDDHPCACSHDNKTKPYHGFQGCDEAIKRKKEAAKARRSQKKPQSDEAKGDALPAVAE